MDKADSAQQDKELQDKVDSCLSQQQSCPLVCQLWDVQQRRRFLQQEYLSIGPEIKEDIPHFLSPKSCAIYAEGCMHKTLSHSGQKRDSF